MKATLKPETINALQAELTDQGMNVVWAWSEANPKQVKEWEADGSLLQRAKAAQDQAQESVDQATKDGQTHLAQHEIYEMYGGPSLKP